MLFKEKFCRLRINKLILKFKKNKKFKIKNVSLYFYLCINFYVTQYIKLFTTNYFLINLNRDRTII